jgi:hypothetical protein
VSFASFCDKQRDQKHLIYLNKIRYLELLISVMNTLRILCLFTFLSFCIRAQNIDATINYRPCSGFAVSKPLAEMPLAKDNELEDHEKEEIKIRRHIPQISEKRNLAQQNDPIAQTSPGNKTASPPIVNWQGTTGNASPPDPSGAAGPSHYVQAVNLRYTVYNKTGTILGGPYALNSLWAGSTNDGDPVVMYDRYADRWFVQQFNGNDLILVAVSTGSNPLGTYYTYTFIPKPGDFPDYPKFSIWSDGYYCTSNTNSPYQLAAFDRTKMLAGNPSAGMISLTVPPTPSSGFFSALPADADGTLPPFGTPCPIFTYEDDTWSSGGTDQLRIYKMTTDWVTPANSTLVLDQTLPTTTINVNFDINWDDVKQPGISQKLDAIGGVLMYRAQYRRWTGYNSVVVNHAVIVDPITEQVGIRWYELRQNTSSGVWSIYQEGTYAPDLHSRWMGSIAMDDNGSIGMAYAVSSGTVYPSLRYTGRNPGDPLGQMTFSETIAVAGTSSQNFFNRFGDYSHTSLDPDGLTFWHTGEYISGGGKTRIFSWQIPNLSTSVNEMNGQANVTVAQNENSLYVKGLHLPYDMETQVDVFDVMGKLFIAKKVKPESGTFEIKIDVNTLAPGTYLVRCGNGKFQKIVKVLINK